MMSLLKLYFENSAKTSLVIRNCEDDKVFNDVVVLNVSSF